MSTINKYINQRAKGLVQTVIGFEEFMRASYSEIQNDQLEIKKRKEEDPNLTAEDVKEEIVSVAKRFFKLNMVEQNMKNTAAAISELQLFAKALEVEVILEGEEKEEYEMFVDGDRDMFAIDKGKVVPIDEAKYADIEKQLVERVSEESKLKESFSFI